MKAYKPDDKVHLVIKESKSSVKNLKEKEQFTKLIRQAAFGLHKNYKNNSQRAIDATNEFQVSLSKNFDGRTFSQFIKYLNELKKDVLETDTEVTADMFLIFLDKIKSLTHSDRLNEMILGKLKDIDIEQLQPKSLLNTYQKHSADFKFEEKLRMGEIKKFADEVIP